MKYLIGLKPLKHNANTNSYAVVLELDWSSQTIIRDIKLPSASFTSDDGYMRSNAQGIDFNNGKIYTSQWNYLSIIDYNSFKVEDAFSHKLMSDVHGIKVTNNKIYVCSTGIDALLCFDKESYTLQNIFRPENSKLENKIVLPRFLSFMKKKSSFFYKRLKKTKLMKFIFSKFSIKIGKKDYRGIDKTRSALHSHHLNEVNIKGEDVYVLTKGWNDTISSSLIKLDSKMNNEQFVCKPNSFAGAHDIVFEQDKIIVTQSHIESIGIFDKDKITTIQLTNKGYFVRGLEKSEFGYLVGFTPKRNSLDERFAFIREYNYDFSKILNEFVFDTYYSEDVGSAIHVIFKVN